MKYGKLTVKKELSNGMVVAECVCTRQVSLPKESLHDNSACESCLKRSGKVYGVGINDSKKPTTKDGNEDHLYTVWRVMLQRCYSMKYQARSPSYRGATVCKEWLRFSAFRDWALTKSYQGMELDKDIKVEGNKVYSPDTCLFVPREINQLFFVSKKNSGLPTGVRRKGSKFAASCADPSLGKNGRKELGSYGTPEKAGAAYRLHKAVVIRQMARTQNADVRVAMVQRAAKLEQTI